MWSHAHAFPRCLAGTLALDLVWYDIYIIRILLLTIKRLYNRLHIAINNIFPWNGMPVRAHTSMKDRMCRIMLLACYSYSNCNLCAIFTKLHIPYQNGIYHTKMVYTLNITYYTKSTFPSEVTLAWASEHGLPELSSCRAGATWNQSRTFVRKTLWPVGKEQLLRICLDVNAHRKVAVWLARSCKHAQVAHELLKNRAEFLIRHRMLEHRTNL